MEKLPTGNQFLITQPRNPPHQHQNLNNNRYQSISEGFAHPEISMNIDKYKLCLAQSQAGIARYLKD
ncbi:TPA: hypothetical protein ACS78B_003820, partial [Providencia alcalifaciens]